MLTDEQRARISASMDEGTTPPPPVTTVSPTARLAAVQSNGTTPEQAAVAAQYGPPAGITPDIALAMAPQVKAAAQQQENARILSQNPKVAAFVGQSQTHAAAAQDSLPQLAALSAGATQVFHDLLDQTVQGWKDLYAPITEGFAGASQAEKEQHGAIARDDLLGTLGAGLSRVEAAVGIASAPISGPLNYVTKSLSRPAAFIDPYVDTITKKSGPLLAGQAPDMNTGLAPALAKIFAGQPLVRKDQPQAEKNFSTLFSNILGILPIGEAEKAVAPRRWGEGAPTINEFGYHDVNDKGMVTDVLNRPFLFDTPEQAAKWSKQNLQDTGQKFSVFTDPNLGVSSIKAEEPLNVTPEKPAEEEPAGVPIDEIIAKDTQQKLTTLQELVDKTPMPAMINEFLDQHGLGDTWVYVDPGQIMDNIKHHELPKDVSHYDVDDAAQSGVKLPMKLSTFLTMVTKVPAAKNLIQHTSFAPDEPTQAELSNSQLANATSIDVVLGTDLNGNTITIPGAPAEPKIIPHLGAWYYSSPKPGGTQPGAFYYDENGDDWLVKGSDKPNPDRARNEVLASQLMKEAAIPAPEMKLIELGDQHGGGLGVASKRAQIYGIHAKIGSDKEAMQDQFAVHAWLGNRDVIGTGTEVGGSDNSGNMNGEVTHFDPGGAMLFRAMGAPKTDFGPVATEWDSLRDPKYPHSHAWFGDMTADQLQASASRLLMVSDEKIKQLVSDIGLPPSLADTLIARKDDILLKGGVADPVTLPVAKTFAAKVEGAIAKVAGERGIDKLFTEPKAAGMTKKRFNLYGELVDNAFNDLKDKLFEKILRRLQRDYKKQYNDAYARHLNDATAESLDHPVMKANYSLRFTTQGETLDLTKDNEFVQNGQPITFYHSSNDPTIGAKNEELKMLADATHPNPKLNPIFQTKRFKVISFTTEKEFNYGNRNIIYVVHLKGKKIGDASRPEDVEKAAQWLKKNEHEYESLDSLRQQLRDYSWPLWENLEMQKALGWEGSYMKETPSHYLNANVQSGNQVYFKYALPQDAIKLKIALSDRANYPKDLTDRLPRGIFGKSGVTADQVAVQFGVGSGQELLEKIAEIEEARGSTPFRKWHMDEIKKEATRRTIDEVGNLLDPARIMQDARDAFDEPTIEHLLTDRLKDLAKEQGLPFEPGMVQAHAQDLFDKLTAKESVNYRKFQAAMKRTGDELQDALLSDKIIPAFQAAQAQLINFYQLRMSNDFAKRFVSDTRVLRQLRTKKAFDVVEANVLRLIQFRMRQLHLPIGLDDMTLVRDIAASPIKDLHVMVQQLQAMGLDIDYVPVPPGFATINEDNLSIASYARNITSREHIDQMNMIKALAKEGREWNQVIAGEEKAELNHLADQVEANAGWIGGGKTPQDLLEDRNNFFQRASDTVQAVVADMLRPEIPALWMDRGNVNGPITKFGVTPLMKAKYVETDLTEDWQKDLTSFEGAREVHNSMHLDITAPPEFVVDTPYGPWQPIKKRGNMLKAVSHLGTPLGRMKLFKGLAIPEEHWDALEKWLLDQVTPAEQRFLQALWGQYKKLFPLADANHRDIEGYGIEKQPHRTLLINGQEVEAGYVPLTYDQNAKHIARAMGLSYSPAPLKVVSKEFPVSVMPDNGYTKSITNFVGPLDLNWMNFGTQGASLIHDIAFRKPLLQAQKIFTNGRIMAQMQLLLGNEYAKLYLPWLQYIAQERMFYNPALDKSAQAIQTVQNNIAYAHIAWQLHSAMKHLLIGTSHMLTELNLDVGIMSQVFADLVGNGSKQQYWQEWTRATFGDVRGIKWNLDATLHDMRGRNPFGMNLESQAKELGVIPFTIFKQLESYMVALAKYRQGMATHGDHERAVDEANKAVRDTQGAGHPVDQATVFQTGGKTPMEMIGRSMTRFMSFENTGFNRDWWAAQQLMLAGRKFGEGDKEAAAAAAKSGGKNILGFAIMTAVLVSAFETFVQGFGDKKKKLPEREGEQLLWAIGRGTIGAIPGINIVYNSIEGLAAGQLDAWGELIKSAVDHPLQHREIEIVLKAAGELWGIPDTVAHEAQAGWDAFHQETLDPASRTLPAWLQRTVAGGQPKYLPKDQGHNQFRGRPH